MTWVCPCCGAAHDGEDPSTRIPGDVTGNHRLVAMMLLERPRTAEELVRDLYGNRPDGGPQSALSNVRVAIHRLLPSCRGPAIYTPRWNTTLTT